jgi:hypothetical protein
MIRLFVPILMGLTAVILLSGCLGLSIGGGTTNRGQNPTVGQQLIDLQKARDAGIITEAEHQTQKARVLGAK